MSASRVRRSGVVLLGALASITIVGGLAGCGFTAPSEQVTGTVAAKHTTPNRIYLEGVPVRAGSIYYLTVRTCDTGPECDRTIRVGAETYRDSRVGETVNLGN